MNWNKPEYLFQPTYLFRRIAEIFRPETSTHQTMRSFGMELEFNPQDTIGASLWRFGIYDLAVSEVLWRLLDEGEIAWDLGANLGCMTTLMIRRVGHCGSVLAFEPHPQLGSKLTKSLNQWKAQLKDFPDVLCFQAAVAEGGGTRKLVIPSDIMGNCGISYLGEPRGKDLYAEVPCLGLDEVHKKTGKSCRLMKLDIEGGELSALKSGEGLLRKKEVRDIVFEDCSKNLPSEVMSYLESLGYQVFNIKKSFFKPVLVDVRSALECSNWEPTNYLATLDPSRALEKMKKNGWGVLSAVRAEWGRNSS